MPYSCIQLIVQTRTRTHFEGNLNHDECEGQCAVVVGGRDDAHPSRVPAQEEYGGDGEKCALENSLNSATPPEGADGGLGGGEGMGDPRRVLLTNQNLLQYFLQREDLITQS